LVARLVRIEKVRGSIPLSSTPEGLLAGLISSANRPSTVSRETKPPPRLEAASSLFRAFAEQGWCLSMLGGFLVEQSALLVVASLVVPRYEAVNATPAPAAPTPGQPGVPRPSGSHLPVRPYGWLLTELSWGRDRGGSDGDIHTGRLHRLRPEHTSGKQRADRPRQRDDARCQLRGDVDHGQQWLADLAGAWPPPGGGGYTSKVVTLDPGACPKQPEKKPSVCDVGFPWYSAAEVNAAQMNHPRELFRAGGSPSTVPRQPVDRMASST
jgi:hypothetical protein